MGVYLFVCFCFFFSRGDRIDHLVREFCESAHSNANEKF